MATDEQLLQEPQWTDPNKQWYISSKPVKRILGKNGSAPPGTIFQVDYEHSKLKEKQKKEIILKSCHKGTWKVKWAPGTFYGLDDESKDLLLGLTDQNNRFKFYQESQDCLQYGKTLKVGDDVCVRHPKKKEYIIGGEVKYKGPVEDDSSATWFGVELVGNWGDTDGVFKKTDRRLFTCEQGRGLFVTIKFIIPPWVNGEVQEKLPSSPEADADAYSGSSQAATNTGLNDIPQTHYIYVGDEVMLRAQMNRGGKSQLVVGHVALVHEDHVAVNVLESEDPVFKPWNGFFKGKKIYPEANKQTVWLKLNEVERTYTPSESAPHEDKVKSSNATTAMRNIPQRNVWKKEENKVTVSSVNTSCMDELQKNVQETNNIGGTKKVKTTQPHSIGPSSMGSDVSTSDSRVSSSSSVEIRMGKRKTEVARFRSYDDLDKPSGDKASKAVESKGSKFTFKGMMSNMPRVPGFARGAPPEFPLQDFHIDALSKDMNIVKTLVSELQLNEKWEATCRQEKRDYFRVDLFFKWWWFNHIREGYKAELRQFTDILAKHGREDLRDHINKVPDFGTFHETVVVMLASSVGHKWRILMKELGLKEQDVNDRITGHMSSHECMQGVLEIWQEKEPGCTKLYQLADACRAMKLTTLADDIEQGLSKTVLQRIARRIQKEFVEKLGGCLEVSWIRQDAFQKKFPFLSDRIFHMLCWWSMRQPLHVDKAEKLYGYLQEIKLEKIAEELSRGIHQDDLEATALIIKDNWQVIAPYLLNSWDIDYLSKFEDDVQKTLNMFRIWKRRQPFDGVDLKGSLYSHLVECEMYRAARLLYDGLDQGTLIHLSRKLCFEWSLLANYFRCDRGEIANRLAGINQAEMSFVFLKDCIHRMEVTKSKLFDGLKAIGREDLVTWMQKRAEEDKEEVLPKAKTNKEDKQSGGAFQTRKLDRILMEDVASAVSHHVNAENFESILNLQRGDVQKYLPKSVRLDDVQPHFAILCSWKKKQLSEGRGESECLQLLKDILTLYEQHAAAAVLNIDGSPVDPDGFGRADGAAAAPVHQDLNVNSMVEVSWGGKVMPGVIQWIGVMKGLEEHGKIAGIELEDFAEMGATGGKFGDVEYFNCQYGKGLFLPLSRCRPDSRFLTETETFTQREKMDKEDFGHIECDPVEGYLKPPETVQGKHIGMFKGIQGDHNSCYMDVTLYSMFAFSDIFDAILHYTDTAKPETKKVKDALRETIVNPLRCLGVVRADHVLRFRDLLSCLSSMEGFRTEEKDPEEFIHALLQELLNAKPFLKISQGKNAIMESFVYQIFTDKKKYLDIPTVEDLLHVSFLESDLKLSEVPECFIVQLPRYGKKYKLYDWVIPSLEMDINLLIRGSARPCRVCGKLAFMECQDCTPQFEDDDIIQSFCAECFQTTHSQSKRDHQNKPLPIPGEFMEKYGPLTKGVDKDKIADETSHLYEKRVMELFSVVCIETSHYVAFVKTGNGRQAEWVFFDSMADRRGDQHGYNVPEVSHLKDFEKQMRREDLKDALKKGEELPKYLRRLLSDAYICFYRPVHSVGRITGGGRTRGSTDEGRKQNAASVQRPTVSVETHGSQKVNESSYKSSRQLHGDGHPSKYHYTGKSTEGMGSSNTDHFSQKTSRERHRERKHGDHHQPVASSSSRCMEPTGSYPGRYPTVGQKEIEKQLHGSPHHHQSNLDYNVPMETSDTPSEASNLVGDQVHRTHNAPSHSHVEETTGTYSGNVRKDVIRRLDNQPSNQNQLHHQTRHNQSNSDYGSPMETEDIPCGVSNPVGDQIDRTCTQAGGTSGAYTGNETRRFEQIGKYKQPNPHYLYRTDDRPKTLSDDGNHHYQHQKDRGTVDNKTNLDQKASPKKKMVTPDEILKQGGAPGKLYAQTTDNQPERGVDDFHLHSRESTPDEDRSLLEGYLIVTPEDTSLLNMPVTDSGTTYV